MGKRERKWILNENRKHTKTEEWDLLNWVDRWELDMLLEKKARGAKAKSSKDAEDDGNTAINRAGEQ